LGRRATTTASPSGSRWWTSAVHTMRYLVDPLTLRVPQVEAPRPSRRDHDHGMLQEIDGVYKSQLEAG
jgi:hypothetical protein